jgi:Ca2+-dependent lipid-binding protein
MKVVTNIIMMMMMMIIIIIIIIIWTRESREVTTNRPDKITKEKKRETMHTDRCGNTSGQEYHVKGSSQ